MENNQAPEPPQYDPNVIYPAAPQHQETPIQYSQGPETAPPKIFSNPSVILLLLLVLTFFTPLGTILFLPIVLVGVLNAVKHSNTSIRNSSGDITPTGIFFGAIKAILIMGLVVALCIVGLIGLFFVLIATGLVEFRMGS